MPKFVAAIPIVFAPVLIWADYPLIRYTTESRDPLYSQQQQDVESWYSDPDDPPSLAIFRYIPRASEDLFSVAAAFNLPYESLATLNGWDASGLFSSGTEIMIPNMPGIFVPESPANAWERALSETRRETAAGPLAVRISGRESRLLFHPGEKFSPAERIRFLGRLFSSPLKGGRVTSGFGYRPNPFRGGTNFHPGLDFRAAVGTPVMAARDGVVADAGTLEIYGHFVIINHDARYQTFYAHLDEVLVTGGQRMKAGERIALSGNSGISTGPHLHFEIRRDGVPIDPARLTALGD